MRTTLLAIAAVAGLAAFAGSPAEAQNLPYCARGNENLGVNDCSYYTMQQCRASASGRALDCYVNPQLAARNPSYGYYEEEPVRRSRRVRTYAY